MAALAKLLGPSLASSQIAWLRFVIALPLVVALAVGQSAPLNITPRLCLHAVRGVAAGAAMAMAFYAFAHMRIGDAMALLFLDPVFIVLMAAAWHRRVPSTRQVFAVFLGVTGAFVILQPGEGAATAAGAVAILAAATQAVVALLTRALARDQRTGTLLVSGTVLPALVLTVPAAEVWVMPTAIEWALLIALAFAGTAGQALIIAAYRLAPPSTLAPIEYIQLPLALATGAIFFAEPITLISVMGVALIVVAAVCVRGTKASLS